MRLLVMRACVYLRADQEVGPQPEHGSGKGEGVQGGGTQGAAALRPGKCCHLPCHLRSLVSRAVCLCNSQNSTTLHSSIAANPKLAHCAPQASALTGQELEPSDFAFRQGKHGRARCSRHRRGLRARPAKGGFGSGLASRSTPASGANSRAP